MYCRLKYKRERKVTQRVFEPLVPQPSVEQIIPLHRYYATHSGSPKYRRRISWIASVAVGEYVGSFPGHQPHGASKRSDQPYIRTKPEVIQEIKNTVKDKMPQQAWQDLNNSVEVGGPRSRKQLANARYRMRKQETGMSNPQVNFADEILQVENLVKSHEFVQRVIFGKDKVPSVILYTDEQISDIQRLCCNSLTARTTVLGFDKTYNLGKLHVTASTFKNLSLIRRSTDEHPLFIGPIFLHGNSDFVTYHTFFSHLAAVLKNAVSPPTLGCDDEKALKQAIQSNFPNSSVLGCTRHLKQNFKQYMTDKIGMTHSQRRLLSQCVFGANGLVNSQDDTVFQYRLQQSTQEITRLSSQLLHYFENIMLPQLTTNISAARVEPNLASWTNNNSESINAVLKNQINWRPKKLPELIENLYKIVQTQYADVRKALVNTGDYKVSDSFQKFIVPINTWSNLANDKRTRHIKRFLKQSVLKDTSAVIASKQPIVVQCPTNGGKKPGQRKRKVNAKTLTVAKKLKL